MLALQSQFHLLGNLHHDALSNHTQSLKPFLSCSLLRHGHNHDRRSVGNVRKSSGKIRNV